jgi:hypothetical protein
MTADERAQALDSTILDLRLALRNPAVYGKRRELLRAELFALRLARIGVHAKGQRLLLATARNQLAPGVK